MLQVPKTNKSSQSNKKFSVLEILQFTVLVSLLLYFGKTLFIPLSFSMLISFILYPICKWLEQKGVNKIIAIFLPIFCLILFFGALFFLLLTQLIEFSNEWGLFKIKIVETINQLSFFIVEKFNFSTEKQLNFVKNIVDNSGSQAFSFLQTTFYSLSESVFYLIIIPVYSILILYYRKLLVNVLYRIFSSEKKKIIHEILVETIHAYYNFIKGMLIVYLVVGILNSIGLAIIGIPHPILFGFIASIFTFIPYIGIIISALLPITISWITFNSIWYPIGVIFVFSTVQLLEAYIIFPFAVGGRLKINTLVIILVIIIGGILWGAVGMILFIPFISIIKLIADRTKNLKTLSVVLGDGLEDTILTKPTEKI
ncbi:AI-2E family transporter [Flavobacterium cellulosilyticum]|uniref:AI-2E family transporter n=1 Tax=Flavobacterium cellulosilyticum TaxID=2541731 RepID=A0A4R5CKI5_9FLAO|nr:AI-2E family transporter [Flavobacterium cellulosilyticum]TDD97962.1 AI-2E family transporter [Flavobacterium cellulosilyticum]